MKRQAVLTYSDDLYPGVRYPTGVRPLKRASYELPFLNHFRTVGRSLFALVFAIIGGVVGQWFSCNTASER